MKFALLADIHSNLPALEVVLAHIDRWKPDIVAVAGDIVNRGPRPRECLELILNRQRRQHWHVIRGNHERYLIELAQQQPPVSGIDIAMHASVRWGIERLGGVEQIAVLPEQLLFHGPEGGQIRLVHASMRHDRDNVLVSTSDTELRQQIDPQAAVFCCGHSHQPVVRRIDSTLVVNAGSVGLPFDGDWRAAYAQLTWHDGQWDAQIIRLPYDRARARRDMFDTGFVDDCEVIAQIILAELDDACGHMADWLGTYANPVERGELSAMESVQCYLASVRGV